MVWPKPTELAILTVNGQKYQDWESVMVRHAQKDHPYYHFRFTCSEPQPFAVSWAVLRIRPGDACSITLAGEPAFKGVVCTRQVFYDGKRHHVEIQGASWVIGLSSTSTISKTGEYKDVTYEQYAKGVLKPTKIPFLVEGGILPSTKFPRIAHAPGTSILEALDVPLRSLGPYNLTSNINGDVVAIAGPSGGSDTLTEGKEILEGREIIYNNGMATGTYSLGQPEGNDDVWGAGASHIPFLAGGKVLDVKQYLPQVFPLEVPAWTKDHLKGRVNADRDWQREDRITVFVTVQGWLRPSGGLWYRNQQVSVKSPMLIMDGSVELHAKSVTFTQDDQTGTRTLLELCNPAAMAGGIPQGTDDSGGGETSANLYGETTAAGTVPPGG